ncbi:MAG: DciA family protein [Actinomycetota bacterium]
MGRRTPRPASLALRSALVRAAPKTPLAAAQTAWPDAVGEAIAAVTEPVGERDGILSVRCEGATWAEELSLMEEELLEHLRERLGAVSPRALRFLVG